jgi:hypothetical protein
VYHKSPIFRSGTKTFWQWIKPYLIRFHHWRKRIWKKYHINKILLLLTLVGVSIEGPCLFIFLVINHCRLLQTGLQRLQLVGVLVMSVYLFFLAKSVNVETLQSSLKQSTLLSKAKFDRFLHKSLFVHRGTLLVHFSRHKSLSTASNWIAAMRSFQRRIVIFTNTTASISKGLPGRLWVE